MALYGTVPPGIPIDSIDVLGLLFLLFFSPWPGGWCEKNPATQRSDFSHTEQKRGLGGGIPTPLKNHGVRQLGLFCIILPNIWEKSMY